MVKRPSGFVAGRVAKSLIRSAHASRPRPKLSFSVCSGPGPRVADPPTPLVVKRPLSTLSTLSKRCFRNDPLAPPHGRTSPDGPFQAWWSPASITQRSRLLSP
ncbi:hypothetical protein PDE_05366 [Penicillium oxalicum 114-2]|uniref:Uncharacterized protein n=1 Tax=Penicillium oxalicum (strain 114-2 / CGMCC 5302) TaxID=933388 RepID=S7ZIF9_PENO1|nr:hypothetical protein PDE_05366 [Penicillium oxalicum 114-2]